MCLTIPYKVIKLGSNQAIIQDGNIIREVKNALIPNLEIGDWILCIADLAIEKIPKRDALEIIELLQASQDIDISELSNKFKDIIKASRLRELTKEEIIYLLNTKGPEKEALFSEANVVRKTYIKDFICIHGIIEFSNFCKNDCLYCGLRAENQQLQRYRMSIDEIVKTANQAVNKRGYKLLVLQSGEDYFYSDEMLAEIIKKIKEKCRVFIFISIGERGYNCYKKLKQAGASGALFRFESSNPALFKKLHPKGKNFENRFEHLKFMKELGYFIATGSLIGLPDQTTEDLADDILMMKKWANMISMGPYVPMTGTPLGKSEIQNPKSETNKKQRAELNLKMISVLRLMMPAVRIPVVTALETLLGEKGRKRALQAGANSLMFNVTPAKYRPHYKIYPDKFFKKEEKWEKYGLFKYEESYKMLEERMAKELEKNKKI